MSQPTQISLSHHDVPASEWWHDAGLILGTIIGWVFFIVVIIGAIMETANG